MLFLDAVPATTRQVSLPAANSQRRKSFRLRKWWFIVCV